MRPEQFIEYAESIYRPTVKLISLVPAGKLDWRPYPGDFMTLGQLLHHLSGCPGGILMALRNAFPPPEAFGRFLQEDLKRTKSAEDAESWLFRGWGETKTALTALRPVEFEGLMVTVPWGPPIPMWRACLGMAEHWLNHKYQLFFYLKLMGQPVNTMTLYAGM
jgi:hypothetical protein